MISARGLRKSFGDFEAVKGIDVDVRKGEAFGFLGPNGAGKSSTMRMIASVSPVTSGELRILGHGPGHRRPGDPRPARRLPAGGHARQRAQRLRQPLHLRPLLRHRPRHLPRPGQRAARVRPDHREGEVQGRGPVRRHEAPAHHRPQPDQQPRPAAARRADHRPRPAGAPRAVGPALPAQAGGRDARDHHPLHGRGRAALRPARRDGQGRDRRRGLAARADRRPLDPRGRRAALRGRRARGAGRRRSRTSATASRCCPTGCSSTATAARTSSPR